MPKKTRPIAVSVKNAEILESLKHGNESYDDVIQKLLINQCDVFVEFLAIDNDLPQLHTAIFQLGEDKDSLYYWDGTKLTPTNLLFAHAKIKEPDPAVLLIQFTKESAAELLSKLNQECEAEDDCQLYSALKQFVERK